MSAQVSEAWVAAIRRWADRVPAVRRVYLFGSRTKKTARPDSDLDVAVEISTPADGQIVCEWIENASQWKAQLADELKLPLQIGLDFQCANIEMSPDIVHPTVLREGILLFDRDEKELSSSRLLGDSSPATGE